MSKIEDDIRRVMAGHDGEAPRAADLLRSLRQASLPQRRRAGWYMPFAVAAAVAAVVVGSAWVGGLLGGRQQPSTTGQQVTRPVLRLSCPARYAGQAPWVPAGPVGVDGGSRLVPQRTPGSALVCAYRGFNSAPQQSGWALSGQRLLAGNLGGLAAQLTWQPRIVPRACTQMGGTQINYLIGLSYPGGGRIWVAATDEPNECVSASNGEFTSAAIIGPDVRKAFASGRWPVRQPVSCDPFFPNFQDTGRLGQDAAMVPPGATSVTICAPQAHTFASGYQSLVSALNQLPAGPDTTPRTCTTAPGPAAPEYVLQFSYPEGPPVWVDVHSDCDPQVDNGDLQAASASSIVPIIRQLLTPK